MKVKGTISPFQAEWTTGKVIMPVVLDSPPGEDLQKLQMDGKSVIVEIQRFREHRSLDANAYYWQLLTKVAEKLHVSKPFCHNTMLRRYGQIEMIGDKPVYLYIRESDQSEELVNEAETYHLAPTSQVRIGNDGIEYRTYKMIRGSHTYNTEEMSHLIDGIVSEAKELGIETLPPDEIERMMRTWQNR